MIEQKNGFTFVEVIFVLSIIVLLTGMIIPFSLRMTEKEIEKNAIEALISTVYAMQSYSIGNDQYTRLRFITAREPTLYQVLAQGNNMLIERELPKGMTLASSSPLKTIEFHPNGNLAKGGVLIIITGKKTVSITFQFQRGRMIINESKGVLLDRSIVYNYNFINSFRNAFTCRHLYYYSFA